MTQKGKEIAELAEVIRQLTAHYGLWLAESVAELGLEAALDAEKEAGDRLVQVIQGKLGRALGKDADGLLADVDPVLIGNVTQALRTSWLAADGVWFQAVEGQAGMVTAKKINDTCWTRFAPLEARRAKDILGLPDNGGIEALKAALATRMYGKLNTWEFAEETANSVVFRMTDCRVQTARKRKGLADYPCKSGGVVEYTGFSYEIDPRFSCECVACPPDRHPEKWVCAWRFSLAESE
ncbi:DUF6125 family protein [Pseudodesulfovibrio sediminis]|uniref:Cytosolic protein n=1 Tax=Pseudodesulfovibrio sediminis TaxID=2810563 RepID=A0ABM7P7Q0_9BACT|nr:DUF6125 family protein [Pseudodesulfovibrio sediminis]BCS88928.1 hypothetical protein PSDVSF_21700 [Pseudodesulfovibrio sediminis]